MNDLNLQQALRLARYKELKEALVYALEFEAANKVSQQPRNIYHIRTVTEAKDENVVMETIKEQ